MPNSGIAEQTAPIQAGDLNLLTGRPHVFAPAQSIEEQNEELRHGIPVLLGQSLPILALPPVTASEAELKQWALDMAATRLIHPVADLPPRTGTVRWWLQEALRELHGPQQTGLADEDASPMVLDPPTEASPQASIPGAQALELLRGHPQFDFRDPRPAAPATALPSPP
uniref:Uncharacterized protein n=1 Tax=Chromera velia CCMP2878 TaxID=1169474 RepID=A0A0G4FTN0_9ALVE|eukprot:Cvel_18715.t1-p1 / transcript=Cvel_18715.t1 / gene=Cvel_18715 / organism=Chromera_velia_CCMP2878 / gene_product=hypothetical protein / transcript_product=hypothetical protein / location=Cvel_scaffold1568:36548-37135(-) / protein_length=168 / sequence_SO=supercontig / SO=protein_coding / is_pseudo=false